MDRRLKPIKRKSNKSSILIAAVAFVIACSLPYFLVKIVSHHEKKTLTQTNLDLPKQEKSITLITEEHINSIPVKPIKTTNSSNTLKPQGLLQIKEVIRTQEQTQAPENIKKEIVRKNDAWQVLKPRSGDSMAAIFNRLGLTAKNLQEVLYKNPHAKVLTQIKPSQQLRFLIKNNKLEQLIIPVDAIKTLTITNKGSSYATRIDSKKMTGQNLYITGTVRGSLYTTAQKLNIPYKLVRQMTTVLNKEIDFAHAIRAGDQFSIIYEAFYVEDKMVSIGDVVAVSYTNQGKTHQAIRHKRSNGSYDYYNEKGESFKKSFTRYPIKFSHISSTFSLSRKHPILHYARAHKGIDLAAPIGTPIAATGDGVVSVIGRHNGYGNMIKIVHDKTYSTVYGHMLRFQKGLYKGSKVKRGQIIGYVGQTGLATGPHCHYELHVNNQPRNPTTTFLPTAPALSGRELATFKANTNTLMARLKLYEKAHRIG